MLEELRNLDYHGGKDGLLFFICDVIGTRCVKIQDTEVICSHAPGNHYLSASDLINYCAFFGWITVQEGYISLAQGLIPLIGHKDELNQYILTTTISYLFENGVFTPEMFFYDAINHCYAFKNELFPLSLSSVRNVLISQGFIITKREFDGTHFFIASDYDTQIAKQCIVKRKQLSLEQLRKSMERKEQAGEIAELFVLKYEQKRLGMPLASRVRRISEIDVTAGYDIVSFDNSSSTSPDRFIEVKAVSHMGFHWSQNEYEIAKLKGPTYYLYLIDLSSIDQQSYSPLVINDPAKSIMQTDDWFIEPESYFIKHI